MKPAPRIGVFFDRDGTLTVDDEGYVGDPDRLVPRPEAREAVQLLKAAGAFVFLATNQSGVARGLFDEAAVARVNARLEELLGVRFDAVYVCPHHPTEGAAPYRAMCRCRKPEPGLLERGLSDWRLKAEDCYVVGDAARDVLAGRRLGLRTVLLLNGRNSDDPPAAPDHATNSLTDAARWVLADAKESQTMMELIIKQLKESAAVKLAMVEKNAADIARAAEVVVASLAGGGKLVTFGNGGSAADAQHIAAELAGRYLRERPGLAAISLATNSSALTAIGNDYGFDVVFARQLEGLCRPGDVVLGITTSGNSPNVVLGLRKARELGARTIAFTGEKPGKVDELADVLLKVPSVLTPRIQEGHITAGHIMCHLVEDRFAG